MAALVPVAQPTNVEAAYEDMFKEITRKLYGEETGNGLHTLGTPVAHVATSGPTVPEGERSFTTLMSDRSMAPSIEYDHNGGNESTTGNSFKTEDHLTTAFGLAALMQNGFSTTGSILNAQPIPKSTPNITTTVAATSAGNNSTASVGNSNANDARWNGPTQDIMSWSTSGKLASFNGNQKSIKQENKSKVREQISEMYQEATQSNTQTTSNTSNRKMKNTISQTPLSNNDQVQKRYNCTHCPYSTDRRDLFTRHENIHKEEKPFQCYACLKQFNRADHVKKHFLRMHRELAYDINKTRRSVTHEQKPNIFTQNSNNNNQSANDDFLNSQRNSGAQHSSIAQTIESVATAQVSQHPIQMKQEKNPDDNTLIKIKREKRFSCCYCPWSGADKWGLKRHLNTHTKPFVCMLCDYKAARSERLATHVLKVHNKKACNKCSFLADNQEEYQAHLNEIHLLKMDAISRNTASVAQDFHNAGGVEKHNKNIHILPKVSPATNNSTEMERIVTAAETLNNNINVLNSTLYKKKAMSPNNNEHQHQRQHHMESPPAYLNSRKTYASKGHRLDLMQQDKENSNSIFSNMDYQFNRLGIQFHNYIKEIINKYYAETPLMYPVADVPTAEKDVNSYLEYLRQKGDITLTLTNVKKEIQDSDKTSTSAVNIEKRTRKQAQPKKITKYSVISILRDKYMKRLVDKKKSCLLCTKTKHMLIFPYHSATSLLLHRLWRHSRMSKKCRFCAKTFLRTYSLKVHLKVKHSLRKNI